MVLALTTVRRMMSANGLRDGDCHGGDGAPQCCFAQPTVFLTNSSIIRETTKCSTTGKEPISNTISLAKRRWMK